MKKNMVLVVALLMLAMASATVLADSGGFSNSFQVLGYGHNGVQHYTNYTEKYNATFSNTFVDGYGSNAAYSGGPGQTAHSFVTAPESVYHLHDYKAIIR